MPVSANFEAFEGTDIKVKSHVEGECDVDVAVVRMNDLDEE